jgi:hypothetical protein
VPQVLACQNKINGCRHENDLLGRRIDRESAKNITGVFASLIFAMYSSNEVKRSDPIPQTSEKTSISRPAAERRLVQNMGLVKALVANLVQACQLDATDYKNGNGGRPTDSWLARRWAFLQT